MLQFHERGDVPGPAEPRNLPAQKSTPASRPTPVPQAPLGWEEGGQADPTKQPDPMRSKIRVPSEGETTREGAELSAPYRGSYLLFPGEDS